MMTRTFTSHASHARSLNLISPIFCLFLCRFHGLRSARAKPRPAKSVPDRDIGLAGGACQRQASDPQCCSMPEFYPDSLEIIENSGMYKETKMPPTAMPRKPIMTGSS